MLERNTCRSDLKPPASIGLTCQFYPESAGMDWLGYFQRAAIVTAAAGAEAATAVRSKLVLEEAAVKGEEEVIEQLPAIHFASPGLECTVGSTACGNLSRFRRSSC